MTSEAVRAIVLSRRNTKFSRFIFRFQGKGSNMKFRLGTCVLLGQFLVLLGILNLAPAAAEDVFEERNVKEESQSLADLSTKSKKPVPEARFLSLLNYLWPLKLAVNLALVKITSLSRDPVPDNCYPEVGCFNLSDAMRLSIGGPQPPEAINTTFYFFDNASSENIEKLLNENKSDYIPKMTWTLQNWTLTAMNGTLDTDKPLAVVTHGLTGSKRTPWMEPLVRAILQNLDCTVLVVDWENGANGTWADAAVNTPMVGVIISLFLQKVINESNCTIHPKNITLVGFSMGGQVMGFVGRHFNKTTGMPIGRIAGLDPAGYLFANTNCCLSKSDADYVDVIHTHGGSLSDFKIGLYGPVGDVDFYPNGGRTQAGCQETPSVTDFMNTFTCSHYRAPQLFIESLNTTNCSFVSYGCPNWESYVNKSCFEENYNISNIGEMGYYSYNATGRGRQYLYTNAKSPYCRGNTTDPPGTDKTDKRSSGSSSPIESSSA